MRRPSLFICSSNPKRFKGTATRRRFPGPWSERVIGRLMTQRKLSTKLNGVANYTSRGRVVTDEDSSHDATLLHLRGTKGEPEESSCLRKDGVSSLTSSRRKRLRRRRREKGGNVQT